MIYLNNKELDDLHIGEHEIQRVLKGNKLIWENNKIIYLGEGKSFDIKNTYSKYAQLTKDNFFFLSADDVSGTDMLRNATGYLRITANMQKSYSNGVISLYPYCNANQGNARIVMVSKPDKLVHLGISNTINIRNMFPDDYQSLNANNFLIKNVNQYNGGLICNYYRGIQGDWNATNSHTFVKSYNSSTGVLTCYFRDQGNADNIDSWNNISNVDVYLCFKNIV